MKLKYQTKLKTQRKHWYRAIAVLVASCLLLTYMNLGRLSAFAADEGIEEITLYVNQSTGSDETGTGSSDAPFQTLEAAAGYFREQGARPAEKNIILLQADYQMDSSRLLQREPVPVTIKGQTKDIKLKNYRPENYTPSDIPMDLCAALRLESISLENVNHLYGNGCDITIGEDVKNLTGQFYLYGSGQSALLADETNQKVGKITARSGEYARIVGYVRNSGLTNTDVKNLEASITVGGTAHVNTIIAGSASGGIQNANVKIQVEDSGRVDTLVGENQGFNEVASAYAGTTEILISGGRVDRIYGAGTGRLASVPTFSGTMKIGITGGTVGALYGAGSAAYVVSDPGESPTTVDISVTGGTVDNIFAAGLGGDTALLTGDKYTSFPEGVSNNFGSVTGDVRISVGGSATINQNIYAGGGGYVVETGNKYDTTKNAYLKGSATITVEASATVKGNIYGGGKGISQPGYEDCARVEKDSTVQVLLKGGTVEGDVFGGGETAKTDGLVSVELSGATINGNVYGGAENATSISSSVSIRDGTTVMGNVYGGGKNGAITDKTRVDIHGGTVNGSVYGGALGIPGERLVYGGSTVNMSGGWIRGNLYGGSELSNDGPQSGGEPRDLIFVNLAGGTVSGNVFGGGYRGVVKGSTHLHVGIGSAAECPYYRENPEERPALTASDLSVGGSVYAGGDYGGSADGGVDYHTITVEGTSRVYIDGTGYDAQGLVNSPEISISGGAFGSGASCDAGKSRLITLKNYGHRTDGGSGDASKVSHTLTALQRADQVLLINSHVRLSGQSDIANTNQTTPYSLNRIGNKTENTVSDPLGTGLILQGGSTLVLQSAAIEMAAFKSVDNNGALVTLANIASSPNTLMFDAGTVFRVSYTNGSQTVYGPVEGFAYMQAGERADAYAYAANISGGTENSGFANPEDNTEREYKAESDYRYWRVTGSGPTADRHMVLTAQTLQSGDDGFYGDGFSTAAGSVELPPAEEGHTYTLKGITLPSGLTLANAARNEAGDWVTSDEQNGAASPTPIALSDEQAKIRDDSTLTTFGLFMHIGGGFSAAGAAAGKVVSNEAAVTGGNDSIIGYKTAGFTNGDTPTIDFYLTYPNEISVSKSLGTVEFTLERDDGTIVTMHVEIVTKAVVLADQTVDLYATQGGVYTGKLVIPSGANRSLNLTKVESFGELVAGTAGSYTGNQFSVAMQPEKSQGWNTAGLLNEEYDLYHFAGTSVSIGTTDSRYQAAILFTMRNSPSFSETESDRVVLTFSDSGGQITKITLLIHWEQSVVSSVKVAPGKGYNGVTHHENVQISQKSAVTAVYTLSKAENTSDLWLELRKENATALSRLPEGTRLTLLWLTQFYTYTVTGTEADGKIRLNSFNEMWQGGSFNSSLSEGGSLTVIVDMSAGEELALAPYSLRLRNNTGADSQGAAFTVNNSKINAGLTGIGGLSRGTHSFTLGINASSDTRLTNGAAAVLSPGDGEEFPKGVVFYYENQDYYPAGNKVYLPLNGAGPYIIQMDTTQTAGISAGNHTLTVQIFASGQSAGVKAGTLETTVSTTYSVSDNPAYGLVVTAPAGRIVSAGDTLSFEVVYSMQNNMKKASIEVAAMQKSSTGDYEPAVSWSIPEIIELDSGTNVKTIQVSVPQTLRPGTYRLVFTLGDKQHPYNLIVQ